MPLDDRSLFVWVVQISIIKTSPFRSDYHPLNVTVSPKSYKMKNVRSFLFSLLFLHLKVHLRPFRECKNIWIDGTRREWGWGGEVDGKRMLCSRGNTFLHPIGHKHKHLSLRTEPHFTP